MLQQKLKDAFPKLKQSLIDFFYPPLCFHCEIPLQISPNLLCPSCSSLFEPIDLDSCCSTCLSFIDEGQAVCQSCADSPPFFWGVASVFEAKGPPWTLLKLFKERDLGFLVESLSAYLAWRLLSLSWPLPDFIVPVPTPLYRRLQRGTDPIKELAEELGKRLHIPVLHKQSFHGKRLLLLDDYQVTGQTLKRVGEKLLAGSPSQIFALTFCCQMR